MSKFPGFETPKANFSKLPHCLIEALPLIESLAELKVILYVLRHTWGYQEYALPKRITLDEFENGRKAKDGTRLDSGVGMAKNSVKDGIAKAIDHGFLKRKAEGRKDLARSSFVYSLVIARKGQELTVGDQKLTGVVSEADPRTEKDTKKESLSLTTNDVEQMFDATDKPNTTDPPVIDESNVTEWLDERKAGYDRPERESGMTEDEYTKRIEQAIIDNAKAMGKEGVDVKIENYLTRVPENVRPLAKAFCYKQERPPTKKEDKTWRSNWQDQLEIGLTPGLVDAAYDSMVEDKLTIRAPSSVNAVAERLKREGWREPTDGGEMVEMGGIKYKLPGAKKVSGI